MRFLLRMPLPVFCAEVEECRKLSLSGRRHYQRMHLLGKVESPDDADYREDCGDLDQKEGDYRRDTVPEIDCPEKEEDGFTRRLPSLDHYSRHGYACQTSQNGHHPQRNYCPDDAPVKC